MQVQHFPSFHSILLRKILVRIILKRRGWLMTVFSNNAILRPGFSNLHPPRYDNLTDP
ncbi:hypothetical protein HMPREF1570_1317 [Klebsiella oxytoca KA-2]|jgi:hypothetical protein|nr:hypothetical protein HMPREF1570_1317 [Klebsiella oxytoca KA-2]EUC91072.1 hypothetical protein HMPREF1569_3510 [Klebsiella oxytoca OK-1]